jgi:hypothetical protein
MGEGWDGGFALRHMRGHANQNATRTPNRALNFPPYLRSQFIDLFDGSRDE